MEPEDRYLGEVLHGYRLVELLGYGAFSRVYRAEHLVLPRAYAVKILGHEAAERPRAVKRFEREAKVLAAFSHPNIVGIADFGTTPSGSPFLTMELVDGRTLEHVLEHESDFSFTRVISLTRQIASGLAAAHERGVVHRDLKPANVMVSVENGVERAKILDFGCALFLDQEMTRLTHAGAVVGTPAWAAPEQLEDSSVVGPPADLFALGEIMLALMATRSFEPLERLGHVLLDTDPAMRPTAVEVIAHLDRLLEGPAYAPTLALPAPDRAPAARSTTAPQPATPQPSNPQPSTPQPATPQPPLLQSALSAPAAAAPPQRERSRSVWSRSQQSLRVIVESRSTPWLLLIAAFTVGLAFARVLVLRLDRSPPVVIEAQDEQIAPAVIPGVVPRIHENEPQNEEPEPEPDEPRLQRAKEAKRERDRDRAPPKERSNPEAAMRAALAAKGLTLADLDGDPQFAKLREAANTNPEALLDFIGRFELDDALLDTKLRRVAAALAELATRRPAESVAPLERRYLDLRARAGARPDLRERESIARDTTRLAAELQSAARDAPR